MRQPFKISHDEFKKLYEKHKGIYSHIGKELGVCRKVISEFVKNRNLRDTFPSMAYKKENKCALRQ